MKKNRFITGYSGLRALAVIGVILYHLDPNTFIGGYLGVPIFFVLSGYLVTDHMLKSYAQQGVTIIAISILIESKSYIRN